MAERVSCRCPVCGAPLAAAEWSGLIPPETAAALAGMSYVLILTARCVRCRRDRGFRVVFAS